MSKIRAYYDERASDYDKEEQLLYFRVYDHITWKHTWPYVPRNPNARVLDAAGGTGKWSIPIAREGPKVVLVDLSEGMLEVAKQKISHERLGARIEARQGDIECLDFQDEAFDMVFCDHALCFVEDTTAVIRELARVLKKNEPMVISAQNRYPLSLSEFSEDLEAGMRLLLGKEHFLMRGRIPVHTLFPDDFLSLIESTGVRIAKVVGKGIAITPLVLPMESIWTSNFDQDILDGLMKVELLLSERKDALALAGHIQVIGYKS